MANQTGPGRFTFDSSNALVTTGGGGGGGDVNISEISGNPVALSNPLPVELSDGTNPFGTMSNPLSVNVISGTVTANIGTTNGLALDATLTGGTQKTKLIDTGGANVASVSAAGALKVDGSAVTQPVSGTVTANQGTAAASTAGWPIVTGDVAESTAAWTSATASNTALTVTVKNYNTVIVVFNQGSTITGGVVTFEVSDTVGFTNAYNAFALTKAPALLAANVLPLSTYTLVANVNQAFVIDVSGWAAFRVRLSSVITGSATVNVGILANAGATTPIGFQKVDINDASYFGSNALPIMIGSFVDGGASTALTDFASTSGGNRPGAVGIVGYTGVSSVVANSIAMRTPNFFKTASATAAGNTAVWTPTSGKKFRLMKFQIQLTDDAAMTVGSGDINIRFQDATTDFGFQYDVTIPAASIAAPIGVAFDTGWIVLENGYLSAVANNVLNFNIQGGNPLTTGKFRINVCGVEE
jgi:hypothetical protein